MEFLGTCVNNFNFANIMTLYIFMIFYVTDSQRVFGHAVRNIGQQIFRGIHKVFLGICVKCFKFLKSGIVFILNTILINIQTRCHDLKCFLNSGLAACNDCAGHEVNFKL